MLGSLHQIQDMNKPSTWTKNFQIWQAYFIWLAYGILCQASTENILFWEDKKLMNKINFNIYILLFQSMLPFKSNSSLESTPHILHIQDIKRKWYSWITKVSHEMQFCPVATSMLKEEMMKLRI